MVKGMSEICKACDGKGGDFPENGDPWKDCGVCKGMGLVDEQVTCPKCNGKGGFQWCDDLDATEHWMYCDLCNGSGKVDGITNIVESVKMAKEKGINPEAIFLPESKSSIYQRAIYLWGEQAQIGMAIEECAELIVKLAKWGRNTNGATIGEVVEEIADVEIMMEQLRCIFGEQLVNNTKNSKLLRLKERLKYGEGTA